MRYNGWALTDRKTLPLTERLAIQAELEARFAKDSDGLIGEDLGASQQVINKARRYAQIGGEIADEMYRRLHMSPRKLIEKHWATLEPMVSKSDTVQRYRRARKLEGELLAAGAPLERAEAIAADVAWYEPLSVSEAQLSNIALNRFRMAETPLEAPAPVAGAPGRRLTDARSKPRAKGRPTG